MSDAKEPADLLVCDTRALLIGIGACDKWCRDYLLGDKGSPKMLIEQLDAPAECAEGIFASMKLVYMVGGLGALMASLPDHARYKLVAIAVVLSLPEEAEFKIEHMSVKTGKPDDLRGQIDTVWMHKLRADHFKPKPKRKPKPKADDAEEGKT